METKDTLLEAFKTAAEKEQPIPFDGLEDIWQQIEAKLEEDANKKIIPIWKKWWVAATILVALGIGGFLWVRNEKETLSIAKTEKKATTNETIQDSTVTNIDKTIVVKNEKPAIGHAQKHIEPVVKITPPIIIPDSKIDDRPSTKQVSGNITAAAITTTSPTGGSSSLDQRALNEVVVIGYGTQKRKSITGAVTLPVTANSQDLETPSINNCCAELRNRSNRTDALQGRVAGLAINSASPGAASQIRIRGINTLNKEKEPLYIINGKPVNVNSLNKINPKDIEHVEVLKEASSTALYGSRGVNGVILITMKNINSNDNESYETYKENDFASPVSSPFSTFSIDVDNASYTNIRRLINNGQPVPKDAVRIEEMINFFKYHTPQPTDNAPYAIQSEYSVAPWNPTHNILKISLQGKMIPEDAIPASNLVFLVDVSGSMDQPNKLPLLQASLKLLVSKLRAKDKVAIVTYAGNAGLVLPATSGAEKQTIIHAIDNLSAGGSTAGGEGIELAYKIGKEQFIDGGNNRVVLATDGDFNVGVSSEKDLEDLISEKRKSHIFLTCLGFGMGNYKDSKMQTLAQKGNGNYAYIDNIQEANRVLVKEFGGTMFTIAKDVKLQIEFNPTQVKAYRLIGYETRLLADKDFANDSVDAGEMGSGHTVTALYEIIPANIKKDSLFNSVSEPRYLQPQKNSWSDELAFIKTRYKVPNSDKSIEQTLSVNSNREKVSSVSNDFRLATTVAWFGLQLRDSKLVPNKTTKSILEWGKAAHYDDPDGYIAELFRLIETQP